MSSDLDVLGGTDGNEVFTGDDTLVFNETTEDIAYTDDGTTVTEAGDEEFVDDAGDYYEWLDDGSDGSLAGTDEDVPTDELAEDYSLYVADWSDGWGSFGASLNSVSGILDTLQLGEGITASDLHLEADGNNLLISIEGQDGEILIGNFFAQNDLLSGDNPLHQIAFADGTVWDIDAIFGAISYPEISVPEEPEWGLIDPVCTFPFNLDDWLVGEELLYCEDYPEYYPCDRGNAALTVTSLEVVGSSGSTGELVLG